MQNPSAHSHDAGFQVAPRRRVPRCFCQGGISTSEFAEDRGFRVSLRRQRLEITHLFSSLGRRVRLTARTFRPPVNQSACEPAAEIRGRSARFRGASSEGPAHLDPTGLLISLQQQGFAPSPGKNATLARRLLFRSRVPARPLGASQQYRGNFRDGRTGRGCEAVGPFVPES
jgi:hypothetical protein